MSSGEESEGAEVDCACAGAPKTSTVVIAIMTELILIRRISSSVNDSGAQVAKGIRESIVLHFHPYCVALFHYLFSAIVPSYSRGHYAIGSLCRRSSIRTTSGAYR